jgi:hypothetical protein
MENLKAIAQIVSKINLKLSDFLITDRTAPSNIDILYQKILANNFSSDKEASEFFLKKGISNAGYRSLKHTLKEKLLNTLFFIDPNIVYSDHKRAYLYCCKYFSVASMMIQLGIGNAGRDLMKKVLNKALKFELTDFIVSSSKRLRLGYGTLIDKEKFHYYNKIYKNYEQIQRAESQAEEYYFLLALPYGESRVKPKEYTQKARHFYKQLAPILASNQTPYLHYLGATIKNIIHFSEHDYLGAIEISKKAVFFYEQKPYNYKSPIISFLHHQLICYIYLKDWKEGKDVAIKALNTVKVGSYSWFVNQELRLMLALHSKEYTEAYNILNEVIEHYKFRTLRASFKEKWIIHKAYISFLSFIEKIEMGEENKKKFKIGKFLNSVPIYSKDKRGLNIPILIIQILFMIVKKDYNQSIDRFEAIQKYCSRYIRNDEHIRSNCFINMLLQIPVSSFHKAGVERRSKKFYDKLLSTPLDIATQDYEIEIIPYEDLWGFVMESLETKIYKNTKRLFK